jgi:phage-related minor tail protein
MATAVQNISVRIAVIDGDKARRELVLTGEQGQRALAKIKEATAPASRSLVAVGVVVEQLRYGMETLAGGAGNLGLSLGRLGPAGLAVAAIIGTLTIATYKSVAAFKESEQSANRLATALRTTEQAAGLTAREITELAEELEKVTLFSDEQAQDAATALLYFRNIAEDTFKRALKLSLDYAQANEIDVVTAAQQVGKALQDPAEGMGRLEKVAEELTATEKELIKQFLETNNIAAAQQIILDKLARSIGGQAEGANQGLTGATNALGDEWDKLLESFGQTVSESSIAAGSIDLLTVAITKLRQAVAPTRTEEISQLQEEIRDYENSLLRGKLDAAFGLEAPNITAARKRLKEIAEEDRKEEEARREADRKAREKAIQADNEVLLSIEREYQKKLKEISQTEREKLIEEAEQAKARIQAFFKDNSNSEAARSATEAVDENLRVRLAKLDEEAAKPAIALAEANERVVESLQKRVALESIGDGKQRFVQAELDKLNASATEEYRQKVRQLAAALYEKEEASKAAKEAEEAHKRAVQEIITEAQQLIPTYDLAKQALDEWKEKTLSDLGEVTEENRRYLELLEQIYQIKLKEIYDKSLEDSRKWEDGASRALKRYADEATNAAKNAEEVFGNAARKIEDSLVEALTTGEFSMKKLGDLIMSIQQDILRAFIRQQITGPIAGALGDIVQGSGGDIFGSIFGSLFHEGGVVGAVTARRAVSARAFIGAPRLHNGLMPDEFPAILQKGETVLPKNTKMGGNTVVFNISTPNAQSFMDSRSQIMAKFAGEMQRSKMRNS